MHIHGNPQEKWIVKSAKFDNELKIFQYTLVASHDSSKTTVDPESSLFKSKAKKPKTTKPKPAKRTITVDGKTVTEGTADWCKKAIAAWDEHKAKKAESSKKSADKTDLAKNKDRIVTIEENVKNRIKDGKLTRRELLALIKETKELLAMLQNALKKIDSKK